VLAAALVQATMQAGCASCGSGAGNDASRLCWLRHWCRQMHMQACVREGLRWLCGTQAGKQKPPVHCWRQHTHSKACNRCSAGGKKVLAGAILLAGTCITFLAGVLRAGCSLSKPGPCPCLPKPQQSLALPGPLTLALESCTQPAVCSNTALHSFVSTHCVWQ